VVRSDEQSSLSSVRSLLITYTPCVCSTKGCAGYALGEVGDPIFIGAITGVGSILQTYGVIRPVS
jgi:hypothetical protein